MEDIKNINTSKAKYQAGVTARENKRRNRKPTSFFEFFKRIDDLLSIQTSNLSEV